MIEKYFKGINSTSDFWQFKEIANSGITNFKKDFSI